MGSYEEFNRKMQTVGRSGYYTCIYEYDNVKIP